MDLPSESELRELVVRYARLVAALGTELGSRPLVLPNGRYFPDRFEPNQAGVGRLLQRMQHHAGMTDIPIVPEVGGTATSASSCSSGACGPSPLAGGPRLSLSDEGWTLSLDAAELKHPVALTTLLARSLAAVFLEETRADGSQIAEPFAVTQDLAGVALGLGPLLLEGSYIYQKSCGGPSVTRLTALGTAELAVATSLFAGHHRHPLRPALKSVGATQRAALSLARDWLEGNHHLGPLLSRSPESLLDGVFELRPPATGLFGFLTRKRTQDQDLEEALLLDSPPLMTARNASTKQRSKDDDELAALVERSLKEASNG